MVAAAAACPAVSVFLLLFVVGIGADGLGRTGHEGRNIRIHWRGKEEEGKVHNGSFRFVAEVLYYLSLLAFVGDATILKSPSAIALPVSCDLFLGRPAPTSIVTHAYQDAMLIDFI